MTTVGIIGAGSFGNFLSDQLSSHFEVLTFNREKISNEKLSLVRKCKWLIVSIPLSSYDDVLIKIKSEISPDTIIIDVCSVKIAPEKIYSYILPNQQVVLTHPLFGPDSAKKSVSGHRLILCPQDSNSLNIEENKVKVFCESIGVEVVVMSTVEHDKLMAKLQGLTFFIARALDIYGVSELSVSTPSYSKLLDLAKLDKKQSDALFKTIEDGNPFSKEEREKFIKIAKEINKNLE